MNYNSLHVTLHLTKNIIENKNNNIQTVYKSKWVQTEKIINEIQKLYVAN